MDGEKLDLPDASFDAVLCPLGLMYMPHPVTALREWHRALKPGGWVSVAVFSVPERNGWGALPGARHGMAPLGPRPVGAVLRHESAAGDDSSKDRKTILT